MNQPDLFPPSLTREFVLKKANDWQPLIRQRIAGKPFAEWLEKNYHIFERFERECEKLWKRGRKHFSSRTIIEHLRHESALSEADGEFKINDQCAPALSRLHIYLHPERTGFFELRDQDRKEAA